MALMPDGRTERSVIDAEMAAEREFRRLTDAYLARMREIYPRLSRPSKRRIRRRFSNFETCSGRVAGNAKTVRWELTLEPHQMNEIDVLLDDLFAAAISGDAEAAAFLRMFAPWAIEMRVKSLLS
jgi:hypothetical protein